MKLCSFTFFLFFAFCLKAQTPPVASFSVSSNTLCQDGCITVTNNSSNDPITYSWTFSGASPSSYNGANPGPICYDTPGTYVITLEVGNAFGSNLTTENISVGSTPTISASALDSLNGTGIPDTTIDMFGTAILAASGSAGGTFSWIPNDVTCNTSCDTVSAQPLFNTYYVVTNTSPEGCTATDTVFVGVNFVEAIAVPNAFSPNGDGRNDKLKVLGYGIIEVDFRIFNRFGQLVFRSTDPNEGWDGTFKGKPENSANFVYKLNYRLINGVSNSINGNVTLLR
tara:strand:+ start:188 stop:1036 length:849 start_codon:yes stop_codon:yes gene_type:complete